VDNLCEDLLSQWGQKSAFCNKNNSGFTQELRQLGDIHRDPPSSLVSGFAAEIDLAGVARM
jgi:hypothetical protein